MNIAVFSVFDVSKTTIRIVKTSHLNRENIVELINFLFTNRKRWKSTRRGKTYLLSFKNLLHFKKGEIVFIKFKLHLHLVQFCILITVFLKLKLWVMTIVYIRSNGGGGVSDGKKRSRKYTLQYMKVQHIDSWCLVDIRIFCWSIWPRTAGSWRTRRSVSSPSAKKWVNIFKFFTW